MLPHVLDGLKRVGEISIAAHDYRHVVQVVPSKAEEVRSANMMSTPFSTAVSPLTFDPAQAHL